MSKRIYFVMLFSVNLCFLGQAQDWSALEQRLKETFDRTRIDTLPVDVFAANDTFIHAFTDVLAAKNSFQYPFTALEAISIQYPQDSSFRIFTWQVNQDSRIEYFGAIQMNSPTLQLFPLRHSEVTLDTDMEFGTLTTEEWLGGIVYKIHEFEHENAKAYLLFTFVQNSPFEKVKYIEVLHFEGGKPTFGLPVFVKGPESSGHPLEKFRHIMPYASTAKVGLNFDKDLGIILFDHLASFKHPLTGLESNIPDGTYEGYELQDGYWQHIEKVFHVIMDEAPRPMPVLGKENRDILGRQNKK